MPLDLIIFQKLCDLGNALQCLRDQHPPGSDAWMGLDTIGRTLDALIDEVVDSIPKRYTAQAAMLRSRAIAARQLALFTDASHA